jgi:hypothetical protein
MKRILALELLCGCLTFWVRPQASAAGIYISQGGAGNQSGADAADAAPLSFLNTSANWGSGSSQINPGETITLIGTITNTITFYGSGLNAGQPTTLYFASNAMISAPTFSTGSIVIYAGNLNNIVIDGGVNGLIQCTDNGTTSAYGNPEGQSGGNGSSNYNLTGIYGEGVSNFTVRNLTISNLYNRLISSDDPAVGSWTDRAFDLAGNNVSISNCTIFNSQDGIAFGYGATATSNFLVISNYIMGFNHGVICAAGNAGNGVAPIFYNFICRSNRIDGMDYYESTNSSIGNAYHRDPIFMFNLAVNTNFLNTSSDPTNYFIGLISNVDISYNIIGPGVNPQTVSAGSAGIFNHNYSTNQQLATRIYNNLFTLKPPLIFDDGFICAGFVGGLGNIIANNTIICWHTNITGGGVYYPPTLPMETAQNYLTVNNLFLDGTPGIVMGGQVTAACWTTGFNSSDLSYVAGFYSGYNIFSTPNSSWSSANAFDVVVPTCFGDTSLSGGTGADQADIVHYSGWQAFGANFDSTSLTGTPSLNTNTWVPFVSDTVARGNGTNLYSYFQNDLYGNARSPAGPWDIGAAEYYSYSAEGGANGAPLSILAVTNGAALSIIAVTNSASVSIVGQ